jgi:amino acid adenylation domain-containing protein
VSNEEPVRPVRPRPEEHRIRQRQPHEGVDGRSPTLVRALRIGGGLDAGLLAAAWRTVLDRRPELRIRPLEGAGSGLWSPDKMEPRTTRTDPAALDTELSRIAGRGFDPAGEPPVELELLRLADDDQVLCLAAHPAVLDRPTADSVLRSLLHACAGLPDAPSAASPAPVPAPAPTRPAGSGADAAYPAAPDRPLGLGEAHPAAGGRAGAVELPLPDGLWPQLRQAAAAHGTTPSALGTGALALTLSRYTGADELVLGVTAAALPVHLRIADDASAADFLGDVHRAIGCAPAPTGEPAAAPFRVTFAHESGQPLPELPGLRITEQAVPVTVTGYDLSVLLHNTGDHASLTAVYCADHYTEAQIGRLTGHLLSALSWLAQESDAPVGSLPLLGAAELDALLAAGRGADLPDDDTPVHVLVAALAERTPDRTAVVCGEDRFSYRELQLRADWIAGRLAALGVGPGCRVGVLAERSTAMVAAVLAVLRAGAAYVPVDPANPDERIAAVLADARVSAVLVTGALGDRLGGIEVPVLAADGTEQQLPCDRPVEVGGSDPAYLIYTSGSTGEPKGVLVEHAQLASSTRARREVYPGSPVFLLVSPLAFDSSVAGLWGTLTAGGTVVVAEADDIRDPHRLLGLLARSRATHLLCVPSLYDVLLTALEQQDAARADSLRTVVLAGEPLPASLLRRHFALLGATEVVNEYGPTEAAVWASFRRFRSPGPVDIGGPIPGARLYVLDARGRLVPPGAVGELAIGGAGVARGYVDRPDATAAVFVADPFGAAPHARMYLTGDRVRWTAEHTLEYLGRRDNQVKIRGHRVELGAVEAALLACPGVRSAVVVVDAATGDRLIGHVIPETVLDPALLLARLRESLPKAMVPSRIRVAEAFPVTVNGKADRAALAALPWDEPEPAAAPASAPAADLVSRVAAAWAEVLGVPSVPSDANFFDAGGHSLLALRLQEAVQRHAGGRLSVVELFRYPTVAAQAERLRDAPPAAAPAAATDRRSLALQARRRRAGQVVA